MKVIISSFIIVISSLLIAMPSHYISSTNLTIGEPIKYTIELPTTLTKNIQPTLDQFEVVQSTIDKRSTATVFEYILRTFDTEITQIPSQSIIAINGYPPIHLNAIPIQIISTLTPTQNQYNDIAQIYELQYINWIMVFVIAAIAIILAGFYIWKRRQTSVGTEIEVVKEPPLKIALKALKAVEQAMADNEAVIKKSYFDLTEIFCTYLTDELNINVLDATTIEMKVMLKDEKLIDTKKIQKIIEVSEIIDHYKFSNNPTFDLATCKSNLQQIKKIMIGISNDR